MQEKGLKTNEYYLVVGRFVPENNYETMIREFMGSETRKDLVIIADMNPKFFAQLEKKLSFQQDSRIKFVGTVYNQKLLRKIRESAWGYLHGHEVGGTNPSLLEALGATKLNLLLDVEFNQEAAGDAACYWTKDPGSLSSLIKACDSMSKDQRDAFEKKAKQRIQSCYTWQFVADQYEKLFYTEVPDRY